MMRCLLVALLAVVLVGQAQGADFALVRDGKPVATIVIAADAGEKVKVAADDLQLYLEKMSGAKLPILSEASNPQGPLVLVGPSSLTKGRKIPSGLTEARREEGFLVECDGRTLVLAGNDAGPYHGTEYAVYEYLGRLGVRWYMPGEFGEIVPKTPVITCPAITEVQKPDFVMRDWWCHMKPELVPLEKRWKIRNRMNPERAFFHIPSDSSVRQVLDSKLVDEKPELFGLKENGQRDPYYPNLSNPDTVQMVAGKVKEYFRKHPEAGSYGFAPDDGMPRDFNPDTVKLNLGIPEILGRPGVPAEASTSEEWFRFFNAVIDEVHKEFPDKYLSTNGYANRDLPPQGVPPHEKMVLMFAAIWSCQLHGYDDVKCWQKVRQGQILEEWAKRCPNVWIYGYNYQMLVSGLTPLPEFSKLKRDFPLLHKWGVMGFMDETRNVWMESGIASRWLRAKLEWDAEADVDALLRQFFSDWYGPASDAMDDFHLNLEDDIEATMQHGHEDRCLAGLYRAPRLASLTGLLDQALKMQLGEPYKSRLEADRLILEHLKAYVAMNEAEIAGDFDRAAREGRRMLRLRGEISQISPFFCTPKEDGYHSGVWYWTITDRVKWYERQADKKNGQTGRLVADAPVEVSFRTDPHDEGLWAQWYRPQTANTGWRTARLDVPFYAYPGMRDGAGHPYVGQLWYRVPVHVKRLTPGKPVKLFVPNVTTEAWCWVNGQYVGYRPFLDAYIRPSQMEVDVTATLKPGLNEIVFRVNTSLAEAQGAEGLWSRPFLYEPVN